MHAWEQLTYKGTQQAGQQDETMRLTGQMMSMGIATLIIHLYIGQATHIPDHLTEFMQSLHVAFILFAILCTIGVFA
jgi:hypothetical protein